MRRYSYCLCPACGIRRRRGRAHAPSTRERPGPTPHGPGTSAAGAWRDDWPVSQGRFSRRCPCWTSCRPFLWRPSFPWCPSSFPWRRVRQFQPPPRPRQGAGTVRTRFIPVVCRCSPRRAGLTNWTQREGVGACSTPDLAPMQALVYNCMHS